MQRSIPVVLALLLAAGCRDDHWPTGPAAPPSDPASARGAEAAANPTGAFHFLPPLGKAMAHAGDFDGSLSPAVRVCEWSGGACEREVAEFTSVGGGSERVRAEPGEGHYVVNWHTGRSSLEAGRIYRIRVFLGERELGHADALATGSGKGRSGTGSRGLYPLSVGSTLPIKFRIERVRADQLPGAPGDPAGPAIPDLGFRARAQDYSDTHPRLRGLPLSFNTLLLSFTPATTVGEANAVLDRLGATIVGGIPGAAGGSGILFLRLPSTDHPEMIEVLAFLRGHSRVKVAVQDVLLSAGMVSRRGRSVPAAWVWDLNPWAGNWGLEAISVPQMWNLNAAIQKAIERDKRDSPLTGVLDVGFQAHEDLSFHENIDPTAVHAHGNHVAGIIGAGFNNGRGVDGVNPFARLVVTGGFGLPSNDPELKVRQSWGEGYVMGYYDLVLKKTGAGPRIERKVKVVNTSVQYNWRWVKGSPDQPGDEGRAARELVESQSNMVTEIQEVILRRKVALPVWVTIAGNDIGMEARWGSPMAFAGLRGAASDANIIVVEALDAPGTKRWGSSNHTAHLSAPGVDIQSTVLDGRYEFDSGTSMAAPHVAGLVGYLYTLDPGLGAPNLVQNPVRALLLQYAERKEMAEGVAPRINAFATVMGLEAGKPARDRRVLRMLLDVDDNTRDGNQRVDWNGNRIEQGALHVTTGPEQRFGDYARIGDETIDMRDFRRWRDWLLQAEGKVDGFDVRPDAPGDPPHRKLDLNGDGEVEAREKENVYPRGDFNGDGIISRTEKREVPGIKNGEPVTDLEVLKELFEDPDHDKRDLEALIDSWDLEVDASSCFTIAGAVTLRVTFNQDGIASTTRRITKADRDDKVRVFNGALPGTGVIRVTVLAEAFDAAGGKLGESTLEVEVSPGSDRRWNPACECLPPARSLAPEAVLPLRSAPLDVRDGAVRPLRTGPLALRDGAPRPLLSLGHPCDLEDGVSFDYLTGEYMEVVEGDMVEIRVKAYVSDSRCTPKDITIDFDPGEPSDLSIVFDPDFCDPARPGCELLPGDYGVILVVIRFTALEVGDYYVRFSGPEYREESPIHIVVEGVVTPCPVREEARGRGAPGGREVGTTRWLAGWAGRLLGARFPGPDGLRTGRNGAWAGADRVGRRPAR
jgi:hypothetical protein